jgi:glycosyltransferase involved in cell wall biosynthesis
MTRIIVVSRHFERRLARYASKTLRCPVAFAPAAFERAEPVRLADPGEISIVYAGSVSAIEGVGILIDAFRRVTRTGSVRARLTIVGNPAHQERIEQYETAAADLVADGRVRFVPAVDHARYASLLRGADLLVIPRPTSVASRAGFPYKLVEFIASGVPVVVTRFGDVEEYFVDRTHCLMCAPDDPAALAATLEFAIEHLPELRPLGERGRQRVAELFSFEAVAAQLRGLIEPPEGSMAHGFRSAS